MEPGSDAGMKGRKRKSASAKMAMVIRASLRLSFKHIISAQGIS
jgi:hypothetical protein